MKTSPTLIDSALKGDKKTYDEERLKALKTYTRYSSLVFQLVALAAVGYGLGQWLDGRSPKRRYTAVLTLAGVAIGLFLFLRAALKKKSK